MANNKAFTHKINPFGDGAGENNAIHQSSPHWVLTFVRWADRDTLRSSPTEDKDFTKTRATDPLVVENDCVNVAVNVNKGTLTHSMNASLVQTDVNYMTDVAPGDFVFVNMLNWSSHARRVADQARASKPINGWNDGFKGVFKIQSVRKVVQTDINTGTKTVVFRISGFAFTEFNNTIYFQPEMINQAESQNISLYTANIQTSWSLLVSNKGLTNGQDLIRAIIESFIGAGLTDEGIRDKQGNVKSPNTLFYIPKLVGTLLGVKGATAAKDIYNFLFGIQQYAAGAAATLSAGFNPVNLETSGEGRFLFTKSRCKGESLQKPEYWNQVKIWSILNQFTNSPLNEMFSTFRVSTNGRIMPTIVYRQIPFTNEDFKNEKFEVTRFMNIPRWKIDPALVYSVDIGRDEAARVNFVQYFGRSALSNGQWGTSSETAAKNYLYDIDDVKRSGLRPYVASSNFDITEHNQDYASPSWARIVGDALIGGHLKLNGTLECVGIVDPIAVGDNLEFDGIVYHIEEVAHAASYGPDGRRMFRTRLSLSSGLSKDSGSAGTRYAEMTYSAARPAREVDYLNNQIMPGVSESQDVVYRQANPDEPASKNGPFPQPNTGASINSSSRADTKEKDKK